MSKQRNCYTEQATSVDSEPKSENCPSDKSKRKIIWKHLKNSILRFCSSLLLYALSFIISFVPVVVEQYYVLLEHYPVAQLNINGEFVALWLQQSFESIGTLYISISFLFIFVVDFAKEVLSGGHKYKILAVYVIIVEVLFGCIGIILFCLLISSQDRFDANDCQLFFACLNRVYIGIVGLSLVGNTVVVDLGETPGLFEYRS